MRVARRSRDSKNGEEMQMTGNGGPIVVTDSDFADVIEGGEGLTVVDFWAEWCGPCRMIAPALEEIAGSLGDKVKILKLNVDENPATAAKYGIMSIPTLMIFKNGELASRQIGAAPKAKLVQWINGAI
jgi:thioredoxin 1